jgi:hypothetical protein
MSQSSHSPTQLGFSTCQGPQQFGIQCGESTPPNTGYQTVRWLHPSWFLLIPREHEKMKSSRILNLWWLGTLVTQGSALTLLEALQSYPELSALHSRVNASSNLTGLLASANNFTFLAPTNSAIESFISQNRSIPTEELFAATVQYSLLRGGFPELSFSNTSQFVASNLANASYANVTGGQVVELVLGTSGKPQVVTGNRSISTTTSTVRPKCLDYSVTLKTVIRILFVPAV